jgi:hypothetical protein
MVTESGVKTARDENQFGLPVGYLRQDEEVHQRGVVRVPIAKFIQWNVDGISVCEQKNSV